MNDQDNAIYHCFCFQAEPEVPVAADTINPQHTYIRSISDDQSKSGFRPALPTYYDPAAHSNVTDRIQQV